MHPALVAIRILIVVALLCPTIYAADTPPSDASLKQLLEVAQAHKILDSTLAEMDTMMKNGQAVVIDVRNQASYDMGHIPGSKLIPAGEILNHLNELPRDKMIVTYCS